MKVTMIILNIEMLLIITYKSGEWPYLFATFVANKKLLLDVIHGLNVPQDYMERTKSKRKAAMSKILGTITDDDGSNS